MVVPLQKSTASKFARLRSRISHFLMEPWLSALVVVAIFALLHGSLGDSKPSSTDELILTEQVEVAKQKRAIFDANAAARMDDFLQKHGWVDEIVH